MNTTLTKFIKDECVNYYEGRCLLSEEDACIVLCGKRCGYFEKAVLGPPDYKFRLPGYDYSKLYAQYVEQTGAGKVKVKTRRCDCGEPLGYRQRYCEKCRIRYKREANRQRVRKHRKQNVSM